MIVCLHLLVAHGLVLECKDSVHQRPDGPWKSGRAGASPDTLRLGVKADSLDIEKEGCKNFTLVERVGRTCQSEAWAQKRAWQEGGRGPRDPEGPQCWSREEDPWCWVRVGGMWVQVRLCRAL